jgi:saccharopine dehydrogenase-like NADP-dependent oxidoreductase
LVAPEFDNNPWNYKFTWNPRNVILAGQATAKYLEDAQ